MKNSYSTVAQTQIISCIKNKFGTFDLETVMEMVSSLYSRSECTSGPGTYFEDCHMRDWFIDEGWVTEGFGSEFFATKKFLSEYKDLYKNLNRMRNSMM